MEQTHPADPTALSFITRGAGILLALFGGLNLMAFFLTFIDHQEMSGVELVFDVASIAILLGGGLGLFTQRRWAWPLAILIGILAVAVGVWALFQPADVALPGVQVVAFVVLVVPGALLLATLLSPRTLRWLRHR